MAGINPQYLSSLAKTVNPVPTASATPNPVAQYKTVGLGLEGGANGPAGWGGNYQNAVNAAATPISMVDGKVFYSNPASSIFSGNGKRKSEIYDDWVNPQWFAQNTSAYTDPTTGKAGFLIDPSLVNDSNFALTKTGSYRDNTDRNGIWNNIADATYKGSIPTGIPYLLDKVGGQDQEKVTQALAKAGPYAAAIAAAYFGGSALMGAGETGAGAGAGIGAGEAGAGAAGAAGTSGSLLGSFGVGTDASLGLGEIGTAGATAGIGGTAYGGLTAGEYAALDGLGATGSLIPQVGQLSNAPVSSVANAATPGATAASSVAGAAPKATGLQGIVDGLLQPKNILPAIGAVGSLLSANKAGSGGSGSSATNPLTTVQGQQQAIANELLSKYQSGKLDAADSYRVDQWEAQQVAATKQYYASAGLGNSDMLTKALGDVKAQGASLRSQAQNQYLTQAISALGGAGSTASGLVTANLAQDAALQQAQQNFFANLGRLSTSMDSQGSA